MKVFAKSADEIGMDELDAEAKHEVTEGDSSMNIEG